MLAELLEEKAVVRLLGAAGEDGNQGGAELLELRLGRGVEEGDGGEVDGAVGIAGVEEHGVPGRDGLALADADAAKEVLGVSQIGLLLKRAEAVPLLRLGLLVAGVVILGELAGPLGLSLGYALGLGLLVGGGLGVGLCLGLGGLLCLFALDFGVFGGIPGFENLDVKKAMVSSAMFVLLPGEKVGSEGSTHIAVFLLIVKLSACGGDRAGGDGRRFGTGARAGSGAGAILLLLICGIQSAS